MAQRDESLDKLARFNDLVTILIGQIRDTGVPAVRASAKELNDAFRTTTGDVIALKSAVDDGEDALEDADGELKEALEELAETADKLAESRLGKVDSRMQSAGEDFVEEAGEEAGELREAGGELESDGFKEAESSIKEAETVLDRTKEALTTTFAELGSHVKEVGERFAGVLVRAGEKASEAETEASEQKASVEGAGTEAVETLKQYASAAPDVYQQLVEAVSTFYEGTHDTLLRAGGKVVNDVGTAVDGLATVVKDEVQFNLGEPFEIVLGDVLAPATAELGQWVEAVFMAKGTLGDFETFTDELRSAKVTAANVAQQLDKGLGG